MRAYTPGAPIRASLSDAGEPASFTWQGHRHLIDRVEDVREPHLNWWQTGGEVHRTYYVVTTTRGLICELYLDHLEPGGWFVSRTWD